ncbi:MAG: hypothetical protein KF855_03115 [Acidobacteria bacterium]|nr:hypothetical protein [Acidobacteriota bacterium]
MIRFLLLFIFLHCANTALHAQGVSPKSTHGRFVAFDKFAVLSNPRAPNQLLVVEQSDASKKLFKVIYFPKTHGMRGSAQFLSSKELNYENLWLLHTRMPTKEEKWLCEIDIFFRSTDGGIDLDEKLEPVLRFRSTQIEADLKLDKFSAMPCLVLESMNKSGG